MTVELQNVSKTFKKINALDSLSYIFEAGNIYGITGRNGSGKTVLLKIISGLYKKTSGKILLDNKEIDPYYNNIDGLGILIDGPSFIEDLTGFENLKLLSSIKSIIKDEDIDYFIELFKLKEYRDIKYKNYSIGSKQKLGIIQAVMEGQKLILLDEPFNGIERETVSIIKDFLKSICKEDTLIIITTHIESDIKDLSNINIQIENGKII